MEVEPLGPLKLSQSQYPTIVIASLELSPSAAIIVMASSHMPPSGQFGVSHSKRLRLKSCYVRIDNYLFLHENLRQDGSPRFARICL